MDWSFQIWVSSEKMYGGEFSCFSILLPILKKFLGLKNHKFFGRAENISKNRKTPRIWTRQSNSIPAFFFIFLKTFRKPSQPDHANMSSWRV
jgi:hypothetical protein